MAIQTPNSLIKFCSAETADKILATHSLRWNAPHLFNDTCELDYHSQLRFSHSELLDALTKKALRLIFQSDTPVGEGQVLQAIRRWRAEQRFSDEEEAAGVIKGLLAQVVEARRESLAKQVKQWRNYALRVRICSLHARIDSLNCWRYYADNHQGVALRFSCAENSSLSDATRVNYTDVRPEISTLEEQMLDIIGSKKRVELSTDSFRAKLLMKPKQFAAEQEWRCFRLMPNTTENLEKAKDEGWSSVKFIPSELTEIYFGAHTNEAFKQKLIQNAIKLNRKIRIFESNLHRSKFQLQFTRLEQYSGAVGFDQKKLERAIAI